ncbi:hypothetical protein [Cryobacterium melibiosiphilum]|uniref:hypothetical protein n=1 Tax=Cryobacterium melibiosiphilum TaxID=995039 RepID=UPI001F3AB60C|nr:hypothetical protein [Cryobacterium melibiosiphilum]
MTNSAASGAAATGADGAEASATAVDSPAAAGLNGGTLRQPIVKQPGRSRRAKLLPAPDTDPDPHPPVLREEGGVASASPGSRSANDAQLRQDRPPHW